MTRLTTRRFILIAFVVFMLGGSLNHGTSQEQPSQVPTDAQFGPASSPVRVDRLDELHSELLQLREDVRAVLAILDSHDEARATASPTAGAADDEDSEDVVIVSLEYVDADEVLDVVQSLFGNDLRVTMMREANKLVLASNHKTIERVVKTIEKLDRPRRQVRITAHFFHVAVQDLVELGIEPGGKATDSVERIDTRLDSKSLLAAIGKLEHSRLLAQPIIEAVDGQHAEFRSVSEIPVQQLTQTAEGGSIGTTEFRECGITMGVTPRISRNGIILAIRPEMASLSDIVHGQPIIDRRFADTTVRVNDGDTILLRGWRNLLTSNMPDRVQPDQPLTELLVLVRADISEPKLQ